MRLTNYQLPNNNYSKFERPSKESYGNFGRTHTFVETYGVALTLISRYPMDKLGGLLEGPPQPFGDGRGRHKGERRVVSET